MKFTQGYWMIKQNYIMSYATHAVRVTKTDKEMQIISACRPITNRGAILDGGTLTVTIGGKEGVIDSILLEGPAETVKIYEV